VTDVWGIGRVTSGGDVLPWAAAPTDIEDEALSMEQHLRALGVREGDVVLLVSMVSEAMHLSPLEIAVGRCGGLYSCADASTGDAFRTEALIRQIGPRVVLGINGAVVSGLAERGADLHEVFRAVDLLATSDEIARTALMTVGLTPRRWLKLGPTSAFECDAGMVHVDAARWHLDDAGGEIRITNVAPRLTPARSLATGVAGAAGAGRCGCGATGEWVVPA
jgi:hypothetical protein